jgi:hypothetical protein
MNLKIIEVAHPETDQQQQNKALHPTAYSFVRCGRSSLRSLRFRRRVSLVVRRLARRLNETDTFKV